MMAVGHRSMVGSKACMQYRVTIHGGMTMLGTVPLETSNASIHPYWRAGLRKGGTVRPKTRLMTLETCREAKYLIYHVHACGCG
jgi:hypothetical protein